jgi:hypothetical protein
LRDISRRPRAGSYASPEGRSGRLIFGNLDRLPAAELSKLDSNLPAIEYVLLAADRISPRADLSAARSEWFVSSINGDDLNFPDFCAAPLRHQPERVIRVNGFWFMSLAFSLTAMLAGRSTNNGSARTENWHMPVVVNCVPGLIDVSLFLFFLGLAEFLFNINTTTATTGTTTSYLLRLLSLECHRPGPRRA